MDCWTIEKLSQLITLATRKVLEEFPYIDENLLKVSVVSIEPKDPRTFAEFCQETMEIRLSPSFVANSPRPFYEELVLHEFGHAVVFALKNSFPYDQSIDFGSSHGKMWKRIGKLIGYFQDAYIKYPIYKTFYARREAFESIGYYSEESVREIFDPEWELGVASAFFRYMRPEHFLYEEFKFYVINMFKEY